MPNLVEAVHLQVRYAETDLEERPVLEDLNFSLGEREKLALIGANGAGKSTLLLCLAGALLPSGGSLQVAGIPIRRGTLGELRRRVGLVFQNPEDQFFMPTVEEDIAFGPRNFGMDEGVLEEKMDALLESLGIRDLRKRSAQRLSGGEKRLVGLAGILILEPSLLLLDEPSSFLDPRSRRRLLGILRTLPQAMILATHDISLARDLCSRVILLRGGRIFWDGPPACLENAALLEEAGL
jgi:cobalt/nickel transport system ATP-binding protein